MENNELWLYYKSYPISDKNGLLNKYLSDLEKLGVQYQMDLKKEGGYRDPHTGEWTERIMCVIGVKLESAFRYPLVRAVAGRNKKKEFMGKPEEPEILDLQINRPYVKLKFPGDIILILTIDQPNKKYVYKNKNLDVSECLKKLGFETGENYFDGVIYDKNLN